MGLYGRTIVLSDPNAGETEDDATILIQWCISTLRTKPGTLRTRPDHGVDLPSLLLQGLTPAARLSLPAMAKAALERGRRVSAATVDLVETPLGGGKVALSLAISVVPSTGGPAVKFTYDLSTDLQALTDYMIKGA